MKRPTLEEMRELALQFAKRTGKSPRDYVQSSVGYSMLSVLNAKLISAYISGLEDGVALVCGKIK